MVRPSSCTVKGGIPSSQRYLPTYLPCASEGNPKVDEWLTEQKRIADLCRSLLEKKRSKENRTKNCKGKEAIYQIGDWVLVHHSRFKSWPRNTLDSPYFGPLLVTDVAEGSVWITTHPKYRGLTEVAYPQLKHYDVPDDLYDWEEDLQESLEAAAAPAGAWEGSVAATRSRCPRWEGVPTCVHG